jgi:drug/metabolite transporter (DMT)-like permease
MPTRTLGLAQIALCAVIWSTSGIAIKVLPWPSIDISGGRSGLAAILLGIMALVHHFKTQGFNLHIQRRAAADRAWTWAAGLCYAYTMTAFVLANKLTSSANAILLQYSSPVWAAVLGWFFLREKLKAKNFVSMALVVGGLVLFFGGDLALTSSRDAILGDILALSSGLTYGATSVFMRKIKDGRTSGSMLAANFMAGLVALPFVIKDPPSLLNSPTQSLTDALRQAQGTSSVFFYILPLLSILWLGTVHTGLGNLLYAKAITKITAFEAMLTSVIEPILNPVWVLIFTGERPAATALAGGALIIIAVLVSGIERRK